MKKVFIGIIVVFLLIVGIDIVLLLNGIPTISETVLFYSFTKKIVFFPLLFGILIGHFFIPSKLNIVKKWYILLIIGNLILLVCQVLAFIINIHPLVFVGIGIASGAILWNQTFKKEKQ